MPKAAVLQSSFNAGELSPLLYGRTDSPKYKQGLEVCKNYIPTLQGPLIRRPATKFVTTVKDSTKPPVFIEFKFSQTQNYMLEFGDLYIRFYTNGGQIVTSGTVFKITSATYSSGQPLYATRTSIVPNVGETISSSSSVTPGAILELTSPYAYTDVGQIKVVQNNNVLYLLHPNYPPYKLERASQLFWNLKQIAFQDGPYIGLNSYATLGDFTNVQIVGGASFCQTVQAATVSAMASSGGLIAVTTGAAHGLVTGQKIYIHGVSGTTESNNYDRTTPATHSNPASWTITVTSPTVFTLNGSTFTNAYSSGGAVFPAIFDSDINAIINNTTMPDVFRIFGIDVSGVRFWGTIFNFQNSATFNVNWSVTGSTSGTSTAWSLGVWSYTLGFPTCGTFHQNRLFLTGSAAFPQEVEGSSVGLYENFASSDPATLDVTDANALQFTLASNDSNALHWLVSNAQGLLSGSDSAEWVMTPSSQSDALTPTNFNAQQSSFFGSMNAQALGAGNAAIYIQRCGRKIREMNFFFQVGTFRSTDLTELSEHITVPSLTKIVYQRETQPLIWAIRSDGNLISMIYDRNDTSIQGGWTRHVLGGQSDSSGTNPIVYSMGIIPSPDTSFDQLWLIVKRYINGATIYSVEYMTKIFDDSILQEDAFQGDCGSTYDLPKTITGISKASPAVVSASGHGFSNGDSVRISSVIGLGKINTDQNGNVTISNLVNDTTFIVASAAANSFALHDFQGNPVDSTSFGSYVSGGQARKLVMSIAGLTWLEGETVGVLADGGIHPDVVVSNSGGITLEFPAAKVQVGYRFKSQGKLLRSEAGAADGTSIGKTRRTTRAAIQVHRAAELSLGTVFDSLIPIQFSRADVQKADEPVLLASGIFREGLESSYDFESVVCFQQDSMLPGAIQSITSFMEETDV